MSLLVSIIFLGCQKTAEETNILSDYTTVPFDYFIDNYESLSEKYFGKTIITYAKVTNISYRCHGLFLNNCYYYLHLEKGKTKKLSPLLDTNKVPGYYPNHRTCAEYPDCLEILHKQKNEWEFKNCTNCQESNTSVYCTRGIYNYSLTIDLNIPLL